MTDARTIAPQPTDAAAQPTQPQNTSAPAPAPQPTSQQDTDAPEPGPDQVSQAQNAPATAPARALPPSTSSGVHGVLANVALGALAGAVTGMKKVGSGLKKAAPYIPVVAAAQRKALEAQDTHQENQQKMQQDQTKSMDDHQVKQLAIQNASLDQLHKIAENRHLESMYKDLEDEQRNVVLTQHLAQDEADRAFLTRLAEAGVQIEHKPFSQFTPADGQALGNDQKTVVSNGQTGKEAGGGFISNQQLEGTVLPHDMSVISDWTQDDKGKMTPVYRTLKAGENTAMDALVAHDAGMDKFNQMQKMYQDQLKNQQTAAATTQDMAAAEKDKAEAVAQRASASLNEAYAKQIGGGGAGGTPTTEVSQALAALPPTVQKDLQNFEPGIQGLLIRGAGGWIDPNTFPQRLTKGGIGITRSTASALMTEINPNWTDALYGTIKKANDDFITGKEGQAVRSFNQFLVHSATLQQISNDFQRTNSPWLQKPLNVVSSQGLGDPEVPQMMAAIEAARNEWQTFIDSGYKPDSDQSQRAAVLMSDKSSPAQIMGVLGVMGDQAVGRLDQLNESYKTATGTDYPNLITPSGREAANSLGLGNAIGKYRTGGSYNQGRTAPKTPQVPQGKVPAYSKTTGQIIGYADDANGTNYTKF